MANTDTNKLIAAFFIGIALTLGTVFTYSKLSQATTPKVVQTAAAPVVDAPSATRTLPPPAPSTTGDMTPPTTQPALAEPAPMVRETRPVEKPKHRVPAVRHEPAPQDLARNTVPVNPVQNDSLGSMAPPTPQPAPVQATSPASASTAAPVFNPAPAPPPAPVKPHVVTLPTGTAFSVRLTQPISSAQVTTGDSFEATLAAPVISDGFVIADKGARVRGRVVEADRSGRVKGRASLTLALAEINTTDGQHLNVQTDTYVKEAQGTTKSDTAKVAGGAALGAIIGAIAGGGKGAAIGAGSGGAAGTGVVLATRGKEVVLPSETPLTFRLSAPLTITEQIRN